MAAWVKLKLASQSQERGPDWDEENPPRMEGVEAELLPKTRKPAQAKVQTSSARGNAAAPALGGFRVCCAFPRHFGVVWPWGGTRLRMCQRKA